MSVAGHLCVLNTLILEDCSVRASGFPLAHGDGLKLLNPSLFAMMVHVVILEIN